VALALAVVLATLLPSCAAALVHAEPQDVALASGRWPGVTVESLEQDRAVYVVRCSRCHALHVPEEHAPGEWPELVSRMTPKAKLSSAEREAISRFLQTTSARLRGELLSVAQP
jgi:hypothetical protein